MKQREAVAALKEENLLLRSQIENYKELVKLQSDALNEQRKEIDRLRKKGKFGKIGTGFKIAAGLYTTYRILKAIF